MMSEKNKMEILMDKKQKKKKGLVDYLLTLVMLAAVGIFLYAGYNLFMIYSEYKAGEETYDHMQEYVASVDEHENENSSDTDQDASVDAQPVLKAPITVDFQQLKTVNEDIIGWIYMEAIPSISYPIVQGEDNDYYLHHTVEGKRNSSASIFVDFQNAGDFTDANTIVYGHNMKNQSMFGLLKQYKKAETCAASPYFWILTPEQDYRYELFSVREVSERDEVYSLFSSSGEEFKAYLERMQVESLVPFNLTFDGTEKIVTLSTCTTSATKRCVVQGVREDVE